MSHFMACLIPRATASVTARLQGVNELVSHNDAGFERNGMNR